MRYVSTRGAAAPVSFTQAVLAGLAPDGGLYVPETYPDLSGHGPSFALGSFAEAAGLVLAALKGAPEERAPDEGAPNEGTSDEGALGAAYRAGLWPPAATPLRQLGPGHWALELFHGPSLSFKDVALQLIARLYEDALARSDERLTVVCATSGDTGGAAVEALKGSARIDLFVLLPKGRVSEVQRRFMTASGAGNVFPLEVEGDFDVCQALVKGLFADRAFARRARLSGVNSINWARITAQSVYYQIAAHALASGGPVHVSVPTGNFGDAFSGYVAKLMGAPIGLIGLAVNANDILARALATGRYERSSASAATLSPAMDIQVASNFERMVFEALDRDGEHVARLYGAFAERGCFTLPPRAHDRLREAFFAVSVSDSETEAMMAQAAAAPFDYMACPHTAVGLAAWRALPQGAPAGPRITLATAHPAKFPETVRQAVGAEPPLPAFCRDLFDRPEAIDCVGDDLGVLQAFIRERSRAWR